MDMPNVRACLDIWKALTRSGVVWSKGVHANRILVELELSVTLVRILFVSAPMELSVRIFDCVKTVVEDHKIIDTFFKSSRSDVVIQIYVVIRERRRSDERIRRVCYKHRDRNFRYELSNLQLCIQNHIFVVVCHEKYKALLKISRAIKSIQSLAEVNEIYQTKLVRFNAVNYTSHEI